MKIVYMGTPDFAVPPLKKLYDEGYDVAMVVTQPDKARDRGKKVQYTPVKELAVSRGTTLLQPDKIKNNAEFLEALKTINPDIIIVAAYGKILPTEILKLPRLGCINIHASLLPKYRGAAPIHRCIIEGEEETGITLMYMEEGLDTGDMIAFEKTRIEGKNVSELHEELAELGAELLIKTLPAIEKGINQRIPQDDSKATYAPMVFKKDGHIDFNNSPESVLRLIRGMNSWPGAYTIYNDEIMKIFDAEVIEGEANDQNGKIIEINQEGFVVISGNGKLLIKKIQMPGKKAMLVSDYIKGNKIEKNTVLV